MANVQNCAKYIARFASDMIETNIRKVTERLKADGWVSVGGGKHDKYEHPERPEKLIVVPRHKELSPGVARAIAKQAGWS